MNTDNKRVTHQGTASTEQRPKEAVDQHKRLMRCGRKFYFVDTKSLSEPRS